MKDIKTIATSTRVHPVYVDEHIFEGFYEFADGMKASLIVSDNENGFEHASVAPLNKHKTPTWDQMCELKDLCYKDEEEVYQIHPPKSEYVNIKSNCLHLWRRVDGKRMAP